MNQSRSQLGSREIDAAFLAVYGRSPEVDEIDLFWEDVSNVQRIQDQNSDPELTDFEALTLVLWTKINAKTNPN